MFGDGCLGWNLKMDGKINVVYDSLRILSSMDVGLKSKVCSCQVAVQKDVTSDTCRICWVFYIGLVTWFVSRPVYYDDRLYIYNIQ